MRAHSYSDGYGEAAHARSAPPYTATHHPHRIVGTVGNTADPSPDAHTPAEQARQAHGIATTFRFLGIAWYGFLQCQLPLIVSR
ncbi:hypothetical protein [Microcoleus sp. D2_18a_B4]|uniref:hypothetical protein n=1 Tax=Microcoleus sp. D2_18a_B4 TaxID=3055329 RepID=UPI002FCEC107